MLLLLWFPCFLRTFAFLAAFTLPTPAYVSARGGEQASKSNTKSAVRAYTRRAGERARKMPDRRFCFATFAHTYTHTCTHTRQRRRRCRCCAAHSQNETTSAAAKRRQRRYDRYGTTRVPHKFLLRSNFSNMFVFCIHSHTHIHNITQRGIYRNTHTYVMCIYLFCILVNHFRLFMLHFAHAHVYTRTLTRPQLQLLQTISNMRFCLHSYVCMQVCVVVCRTRPTFCIFLFWYRFQNKTTHFPRCKRNSDYDSDFFFFLLSLSVSFYSRAFFLRRNFTTFALLTLCIQFYSFILPLLVNFILHLARAPTHTAYRTHTHAPLLTHSLAKTRVCMYVCVHLCVVEFMYMFEGGGTRTCDFLEFTLFIETFLMYYYSHNRTEL